MITTVTHNLYGSLFLDANTPNTPNAIPNNMGITSDLTGCTPLHIAVASNNTHEAALAICENPSSIGTPDNTGQTPPALAILSSNLTMVGFFLQIDAYGLSKQYIPFEAFSELSISDTQGNSEHLKRLRVIYLFINAGFQITPEEYQYYPHNIQACITHYKSDLYDTVRTLCGNWYMTDSKVRCFLHAAFKVFVFSDTSYQEILATLPSDIKWDWDIRFVDIARSSKQFIEDIYKDKIEPAVTLQGLIPDRP